MLTVDIVMTFNPCYSREQVEAVFAGREELSVVEFLELNIPVHDILWVVLRPEVLTLSEINQIREAFANQLTGEFRNKTISEELSKVYIPYFNNAGRTEESLVAILEIIRGIVWHT